MSSKHARVHFSNISDTSSMSSKGEEEILNEYKRQLSRNHHRKTKSAEPKVPLTTSPYLQNVAPKTLSTIYKIRERPQSADRAQRHKPKKITLNERFDKIDKSTTTEIKVRGEDDDAGDYSSSFESDTETSSSNEKENKGASLPPKPKRPTSAPVYKKNRPNSSKSKQRSFDPKVESIRCIAFRNGSCMDGTIVTASNVKQLLEQATRKLCLNTAARRVYLDDGTEVFRVEDIQRDSSVFISCGEKYKDPRKVLKDAGYQSNNSWSMKGIVLGGGKRKRRSHMSARMQQLTSKRSQRILIFKNGNGANSHEALLADQDNFDKFLDICTEKLEMTAAARTAFAWDGTEITSIKKLWDQNSCLKSGGTGLLGPVWLTSNKGPCYRLEGGMNFVEGILWSLKQRIKNSREILSDLNLVCDGDVSKVKNPEVMSMSLDEAYEQIEKTNNEIEQMVETQNEYKQRKRKLNELIDGKSYERSSMNHIKEIDVNDRITGQHGLRLTIKENGNAMSKQDIHINMREIKRGTTGDEREFILSRFLEVLTHWHKPTDPTGPAKSVLVRRIFDVDGQEILDVNQLSNDQEVYLSYGEDFKEPYSTVVEMRLEKVRGVRVADNCYVVREPSGGENYFKDKWEATYKFPDSYNYKQLENVPLSELIVATDDDFLQSKVSPSLIMHPLVGTKKTDFTPEAPLAGECQNWRIHKNGVITSTVYHQTCLAVDSNHPLKITLRNGAEKRGYLLQIQKKSSNDLTQEWGFSSSAQIYTLWDSSTSLVLTNMHDKLVESVEIVDSGKILSQSEASLVVMDKISGPLAKYQRWAIKQEKAHDQWKHTKVDNPQWKKMSYSWPVLPDGTWNTEYKWPLEGMLLNGPPHPRQTSMGGNKGRNDPMNLSIPLRVYKNGEKDSKRFVTVVAPEMQPANIGKKNRSSKEAIEARRNVEQIELGIFMERATSLLNLPFAARRLFSNTGKELFSLRGLSRDQIVYVSSGEAWQNPIHKKSDSQKRKLLGKLGADVQRIEEYCLLRDPNDLVLMVWGGFVPGSAIIAAKRVSSSAEREEPEKVATESTDVKEDIGDDGSICKTTDTWHNLSHKHSDERAKKLMYSWQQHSGDEEAKKDDSAKSKSLKKKKKKRNFSPRTTPIELMQRFVWKNGFISPYADPTLAVGIITDNIEAMGQKVDVQLVKKSNDDPMQKWTLSDGGMITLEYNSQVALTVSFPTSKSDRSNVEFVPVVVQKKGDREVGYARQRWKWDSNSGNLFAFDASVADKEVTAANHVSICTYVVRGQETLNQDGYVVEMPGNRSNDPIVVCKSCATVLRGTYHMTRTPSHWTFSCAMGNAKEKGIKLAGLFACLNGKVDLSTYEAEPTYHHWLRQLQKLRKQTSVHSINRDIDNAGVVHAWRLYIRQNGSGYNASGELITGSSVLGVLDQATHRLCLSSAARKLFTSDGTQILHLDHLKEMQERSKRVISTKKTEEERKSEDTTVDKDLLHVKTEGLCSTEGTPDHSTADYSTADLSKGVALKEQYNADNTTSGQSVVELWVSCGENFIPPDVADQMMADNIQAHTQRNNRNLQMDTERHIIRHIHGRRRGQMSPRDLVATRNSKHPVVLSGGWMETTTEETARQEHVNRIQEKQRTTPQKSGPRLKSAIYKQPTTKRIVVQQRNDVTTRTYAWGESLDQLLADVSSKLSLRKNVNILFTESGGRITKFEDVERDAIHIVKPPRVGSSIKQKAKWAQDRKTPSIEANTWVISAPEKIETGAFGTPQLTAE